MAYPLFQENAMQFAWILPLSLLLRFTLKELQEHCQLSKKEKQGLYA
jgi:hypothetical protein